MPADNRLFFTPDLYFEGLVSDIENARDEIVLETYIFQLDAIGERVLTALQESIARGVRLKLLLDGVGSYRDSGRIAQVLHSDNSEVRVFHPLPWDFSLYRKALKSDTWYSQILYLIASINNRDHRKLCLIDQRTAWLGSYNITADHANPLSPVPNDFWHDTGLRVTGPVVQVLAANFDQVWHRKRGSIGERYRRFMTSSERSKRRQPRMELIKTLARSQRRIWITNAYFNPTAQVLSMLKRKAGEGVSVRVIVPLRSDVVFFPLLSRSFYADLLQAGIQVFEYEKRILHSKTMLIDDQLLIGSTNLNYRSLFHDLELDLLLDAVEPVSQMQRRFEDDVADSIEMTLYRWQQHPWLLKLMGWFARFLRYWM